MYVRGDVSVLAKYCSGKPVTICAEGGGFRSVSIVGMLEAFAEARQKAKAYVGVSGGACALAGHIAGVSESTFGTYEKMARDGCLTLRWSRQWPYGWRLAMNRELLIRELEKNLPIRTIESSESHFGITARHYESGEGMILDGKSDVLNKIRATVSIPSLCEPVMIDGKLMVDGISIQLTPAIRKYWSRDVIVLRARRRWYWEDWSYPYWVQASLRDVPAPLRNAVADADVLFDKEMERLRACTRIRYLEIGPDSEDPFLWPWTTDIGLLRRMRDNARAFVLRLLESVCKENV